MFIPELGLPSIKLENNNVIFSQLLLVLGASYASEQWCHFEQLTDVIRWMAF